MKNDTIFYKIGADKNLIHLSTLKVCDIENLEKGKKLHWPRLEGEQKNAKVAKWKKEKGAKKCSKKEKLREPSRAGKSESKQMWNWHQQYSVDARKVK